MLALNTSLPPFCGQAEVGRYPYSSLGYLKSIHILEQPKIGKANSTRNSVSYTSDKIGHDRFVAEINWYSAVGNVPQSGRLIYEIDVVENPM